MDGARYRRLQVMGWCGAAWMAVAWGSAAAQELISPRGPTAKSAGGTIKTTAAVAEQNSDRRVSISKSGDGDEGTPTLAPPRKGAGAEPRIGLEPIEPPQRLPKNSAADAMESSRPTVKLGASGATKDVESNPASRPDSASLKPIPDPVHRSTEIEVASFNGVTPGVTTIEEVRKAWGEPKSSKEQNGTIAQLYKVEPFKHIEVLIYQNKAASIIIRLDSAYPAEAVAQKLSIADIRPVLVSNEMGEILGQAYPERGVLFSFEPNPAASGKPSMKVTQIILEPINADPFVLRAETTLTERPDRSLKDLEQALKIAPRNARAQWLRARVHMMMGDPAKAITSADEAIRLDPKDVQYRVTRAQILGQVGRHAEGIRDAEQVAAESGSRVHLKGRALCLIGDLANSSPSPDFKRAIESHSRAIKTVDSLVADPHPAIRIAAKEVMVDAHLGAAYDIAWGNWNQKQAAVDTWLKQASEFADDLVQNEEADKEVRFRVAVRALAAFAGGQGKLDPADWAEKTVTIGQELIAAESGDDAKRQLQRELGTALYDAVQIYQMRNQRETALKYGRLAAECLENGKGEKGTAADAFLLGRLYFRLGSIHAIGNNDHKGAISWYEKAVPTLEKAVADIAPFELGRLGETFVSIGVSYWEVGRRDQAVAVTQQGVEMMEKAVKTGDFQKAALEVPYANLATMHRQLGQDDKAEQYLEKASRRPPATRR